MGAKVSRIPGLVDMDASLQASTATGKNFNDRDELKNHYHSDYHRYNLKRKVAGLPMLTQEQFERRVAQEAQKPTLEPKHQKKEDRKANRKALKEKRLEDKHAKMQEKQALAEKRQAKIDAGEEEDVAVDSEDEEGEWLDEEDQDE